MKEKNCYIEFSTPTILQNSELVGIWSQRRNVPTVRSSIEHFEKVSDSVLCTNGGYSIFSGLRYLDKLCELFSARKTCPLYEVRTDKISCLLVPECNVHAFSLFDLVFHWMYLCESSQSSRLNAIVYFSLCFCAIPTYICTCHVVVEFRGSKWNIYRLYRFPFDRPFRSEILGDHRYWLVVVIQTSDPLIFGWHRLEFLPQKIWNLSIALRHPWRIEIIDKVIYRTLKPKALVDLNIVRTTIYRYILRTLKISLGTCIFISRINSIMSIVVFELLATLMCLLPSTTSSFWESFSAFVFVRCLCVDTSDRQR